MTRSDIKSSSVLAIAILLLVVSLTTGFLDKIVVPIGLIVFGVLAFGVVLAAVFHFRKYRRDHPFIPYVGQWAHVLCKKCEQKSEIHSIEIFTGGAYEGWNKAGQYYRTFKRQYRVYCSNGHEWIYDPILEHNEWAPSERAPGHKRSLKKILELMKLERDAVHKTFEGEPEPSAPIN